MTQLRTQSNIFTQNQIFKEEEFPLEEVKQLMLKPITESVNEISVKKNVDLINPNKYLAYSVTLKKLMQFKDFHVIYDNINYLHLEKEMLERCDLICFIDCLLNYSLFPDLNSVIPSSTELDKINNLINKEKINDKDHVNQWLIKLSQTKYIKEIFMFLETIISSALLLNDLNEWISQLQLSFKKIKSSKFILLLTQIINFIYSTSMNSDKKLLFDLASGLKSLINYKSSKKLFRAIINFCNKNLKEDDVFSLTDLEKMMDYHTGHAGDAPLIFE